MTSHQNVVSAAREWVIYALKCPTDGEIRYVGFTRDLHKRMLAHMSNARNRQDDYPVYRWLRKLISHGLKPVPIILQKGFGDWQNVEQEWIEKCLSSGCVLLNVALGGHFSLPDEARKRAGEKLKGRIFSAETRAKISAAKTGVPRTDREAVAERLRAVARANVGRKMVLSAEERERRREQGKKQQICKYWENATPEQRLKLSVNSSEQMKRVWAERRAATHV